ncbi:MAG: DUF2062 domain-containing protein [Pseudomonadota bacterium]
MVFKRRDKLSLWRRVRDFLYPKGGWVRAFEYVKLRLRRLPDPPEKIARGIWAGVFTAFTPFYGLHFIFSVLLAYAMRANILAALLATFFGNPLTYVPIGVVSLQTGYFMLGIRPREDIDRSLGGQFSDAFGDLWHNFVALFTSDVTRWDGLLTFWHDVFFPYLIGGIVPGVIVASVCYYLSVPVIRAYQNRRRGMMRAKLAEIKEKAKSKAVHKKLKDQEGSG